MRKCEYGVLEITRDTKVLSSHSSSTRDLRLLYHLWFPKPHTHISYSQYFHNAGLLTLLDAETKVMQDFNEEIIKNVNLFPYYTTNLHWVIQKPLVGTFLFLSQDCFERLEIICTFGFFFCLLCPLNVMQRMFPKHVCSRLHGTYLNVLRM